MSAVLSGTRVWAIAHNVFRETVRDKVLYLILLFAAIMAGAVTLIPEIANGAHVPVVLNLGLAGINIIGLVVAVFIGAGLMNKEVEKKTVYLLVAKPINRGELIVGKHIGLAVTISALLAVMLPIYLGSATVLGGDVPFGSLALAVAFVFLELLVMAGAAIMFGVITSSLLATLLTLALYVMGHLSHTLLQFAQNIESIGMRRLLQGLFLILPDLTRLNLKNDAIYAQLPSPAELGFSALYSVCYATALLAIAVLVFSRRQF
ncbi:ABC transporter permease [Synechococcus sp. PCC 7336]|uniref:ABC transporter permease n=1 Tax=Synechococcus sp. PCC 7336 TaxID=195250 RepID=UPI00034A68E0|nr:ABC transporter permease [Synechococcus sp. PCC 7336]